MRRFTIAFIAATSILTSVSASALTAKQIVEKETVVQMPDGTESLTRGPAELVIPGERVVYTLNFTNDDTAPATDLVLTMPVPSEIKYLDGSKVQKLYIPLMVANHLHRVQAFVLLELMEIAETRFQKILRIFDGRLPDLWLWVKLDSFLIKALSNKLSCYNN
jgi:uncharacterized repeat protein (TIGR01451 family)